MARYVLAGVTGRVGSAVAAGLLDRGERPVAIVRDEAAATVWAARGADIRIGSLADRDFLAAALRGADGFFTLLPENVPHEWFHRVRREMADAIAGAVIASRVPHVVMLSAIPAALADGNGPAKDLHYLERRLQSSGTRVSALRACYFQDNVEAVIPTALAEGIYPSFMPANVPFPMIATADAGGFAAAALADPPSRSEVVDLLGPAYSIRGVADELGRALGLTLQIVEIPAGEHLAVLHRAGITGQFAAALVEMFQGVAAGRFAPRGDRALTGTTTLDQVIQAVVRRHAALRGRHDPSGDGGQP